MKKILVVLLVTSSLFSFDFKDYFPPLSSKQILWSISGIYLFAGAKTLLNSPGKDNMQWNYHSHREYRIHNGCLEQKTYSGMVKAIYAMQQEIAMKDSEKSLTNLKKSRESSPNELSSALSNQYAEEYERLEKERDGYKNSYEKQITRLENLSAQRTQNVIKGVTLLGIGTLFGYWATKA